MSLLEVNHLKKIYTARYGGNSVQALADVNFTIENGEYTAIMGESGSGKTTLLNIIATLDRPTSGTVRLEGQELSTIPERRLAEFRRKNLGFVFQDFNLLDTFSIRDNILLPLVLDRMESAGDGPPSEDAVRTAGTGRAAWTTTPMKFPADRSSVRQWHGL